MVEKSLLAVVLIHTYFKASLAFLFCLAELKKPFGPSGGAVVGAFKCKAGPWVGARSLLWGPPLRSSGLRWAGPLRRLLCLPHDMVDVV